MNDLYLIGNGFDLAHGLKTSYNDFLLWYLKESLQICSAKDLFDDHLITVRKGDYPRTGVKGYKTIREVLEDKEKGEFSIKYKYDFFEKVVESYLDYKWVDIEYEYYMALIEISKKLKTKGISRSSQVDLNKCFKEIKEKLIEYLSTIEITSDLRNREMQQILGINDKEILGKKLFVCFNYTHTIDKLYLENTFFKDDINYIHGELNDNSNPVIFGYGDYMDSEFGYIKELSNGDFLTNIKPVNFVTDNYQKVMSFISSGDFIVKIIGHSCGRSDRYLLSSIFEHENCQRIEIYHYEKSTSENDYIEKRKEILRHLKNKDINVLVSPFDKYSKMPQVKKDY